MTDKNDSADAGLREGRDSALRVNLAKSRFLSRIGHELTSPPHLIIGFAQMLLADEARPLSASHQQRIELILAAGKHHSALLEDLI